MEIIDKFVDFKKYCESCKYKDKKDIEDPCNECLEHAVNEHTDKPFMYEEEEK